MLNVTGRRLTLGLALAGALAGWQGWASPVSAQEFVNQTFESGSMTNGWSLFSQGGGNLARIGGTGRTFQTGTTGNDEALYFQPWMPGESSFGEGAVYSADTPFTVDPGKVMYVTYEGFSDLTLIKTQYLKIDVRWGETGDGQGAYGFDSNTPAIVTDLDWTSASGGLQQGRVNVGGTTVDLNGINYDTATFSSEDPAAAAPALNKTYTVSFAVRTPATPDVEGQGANADVDAVGEGTGAAPMTWDRVAVQLLRLTDSGNYMDGNNSHALTGLARGLTPTYGTPDPDVKLGIKSLRIGTTSPTDFNLDRATDVDDLTIWNSHKFTSETTLFSGDANNDGATDVDDLTMWNANKFTQVDASAASPASSKMVALDAVDSTPVVLYDPTTGELTVQAGTDALETLTIAVLNSDALDSADVSMAATNLPSVLNGALHWGVQVALGKLQYYDSTLNNDPPLLGLTAADGAVQIAQLMTGLTAEDFGLVNAGLLSGANPQTQVTFAIVPEPGSVLLLIMGGLAVLIVQPRRRRLL